MTARCFSRVVDHNKVSIYSLVWQSNNDSFCILHSTGNVHFIPGLYTMVSEDMKLRVCKGYIMLQLHTNCVNMLIIFAENGNTLCTLYVIFDKESLGSRKCMDFFIRENATFQAIDKIDTTACQ